MDLSFTYPLPVLLLSFILAGALTWWLYRSTTPELSSGRRLFLGSLRFAVLAIVLFLLAEPLLSRTARLSEDPVLAVLVDNSQSMEIPQSTDGEATDSLPSVLARLKTSTSGERTVFYSFGNAPREIASLDSIGATDSRTDLAAGLDFVRTALADRPLGALVLISDGRYNTGRNPERLADLYPVPVVTVLVGDSTVRKDIRIQQVLTNELSYARREVPVRVRLRNEGFDISRVRVVLSGSSGELDAETVELPPPGAESEIDLSFVPDSAGRFQYRIDLARLPGEVTHRNNSEIFSLQILEREKRILLLSGAPSPDVSAMRRFFDDDEEVDTTVRTERADARGTYFEGGDVDPADVDLIVLAGFPSSRSSQVTIDKVVAAAESGKPILFVLDRSTDPTVVGRTLSEVLPAVPSAVRPGFVEGGFDLTDEALRHAVLDIADRRNTARWLALPPLSIGQTRWRTNPGSVVLASARIRGISIDDPVMVVRRISNHRSAALLAAGFWRWSNVPEDLEAEAAAWREVFDNLVQWLVSIEDEQLVRVAPVEDRLSEGDRVLFGGQVYDEALNPLSDVSVTVELEHPSGNLFPYTMQSVGNGQYRLDVGALPAGNYAYKAVAKRDNADLGLDRGTFTVGPLSIEFRNPSSDAGVMRQIASRSGGLQLAADRLDDLPSLLRDFPSYVPVDTARESQLRLWRFLPFLLVMLALMTVEWFFRKRFGLV